MIDLGPLVNKTVDFRFHGADLRLDLSHALFSSFDIDVGTRLLFKAVGRDEVLASARRVLDAGSGIGVIGLGVAAAFPSCEATLRDRDLLAVAFSERNRARNKISNAKVEAGLIGSGSIGGPWDYILSNIPAKAGGPVINAFLEEATRALSPGGRLGVVIVKPLVADFEKLLATLGLGVLAMERGSMHRAYVLQPKKENSDAPPPPMLGEGRPAIAEFSLVSGAPQGQVSVFDEGFFDLAAYRRRSGDFRVLGKAYKASGYWSLPDFDTIGFPQLAAAEVLGRFASGKPVEKALIINPGIGHLAMWLALAFGPPSIGLASRDLLSVVAARENLTLLLHERELQTSSAILDIHNLDPAILGPLDLIVEFGDPVPEYDWIADSWARATSLLAPGGLLVVAAPPTEAVRLEKRRPEGFRLLGEKRKKGSVAVAWRRT